MDWGILMDNYEINASTLCIVPIDEKRSWVYEYDNKFIVNMSCFGIIKRSCLFFGSSYLGRKEASCNFLLSSYKLPVVIEETSDIIFFPTSSPTRGKSIWISYNNLEVVDRIDQHFSSLFFKNHNEIKVEVSYFVLTNQIMRCNRLKNELNKRKKAV